MWYMYFYMNLASVHIVYLNRPGLRIHPQQYHHGIYRIHFILFEIVYVIQRLDSARCKP